MKRAIEIVLAVLLIAACIGTYFVKKAKDTTPPTIEQVSTPVFHKGDDWSVLLTGAKATDDKDGDVSNTLTIERVTYIENDTSAIVTYVSKDKSYNVSKVDIVVPVLEQIVNENPEETENPEDIENPEE